MRRILSMATVSLLLASMLSSPVAAIPSDTSVPVSITFDPDGRLYIGEKAGAIRMATSAGAATSQVVASFADEVYDFGDNGLSSVNYHDGYVYTTFMTGRSDDSCGPFDENTNTSCPSFGQLDRYPVEADGQLGARQTVRGGSSDPIWCTEFASHGLDAVFTGPDGGLYVAAGDGASFEQVDTGQIAGDPCGNDGAFRSQAVGSDNLMGQIARVDPDSGVLTPISQGHRNPFRQTVHNNEIYTTDTGWFEYEEINRVVEGGNYGWPCFEGTEPQGTTRPILSYSADARCDGIPNTEPAYAYSRIGVDSSSISSVASFDGDLYYSDFSRNYINKVTDLTTGTTQRVADGRRAVDLEVGPDGNLYGVDPYPTSGGPTIFVVEQGTSATACPAGQLGEFEPNCAEPTASVTASPERYTPGETLELTVNSNLLGTNLDGMPFRTPALIDWSVQAGSVALEVTPSADATSITLMPPDTTEALDVSVTVRRDPLEAAATLAVAASPTPEPDPEPEPEPGPVPEGCHALSGDWNGSGSDGLGWWCDGRAKLRTSSGDVIEFTYGRTNDVPIVADWNGDGRDSISVVRDGTWKVNNRLRGGAAQRSFYYGRVARGDVPITGAWDGGTRDLPGVIRDRVWYLRDSQSGGPADQSFIYGRLTEGDLPLVGDWTGDQLDTVGVVRQGQWLFRTRLAGGPADFGYVYGRVLAGDVPVTGDWTGDGVSTPGIVRNGRWYLKAAHGGGPADEILTFGAP